MLVTWEESDIEQGLIVANKDGGLKYIISLIVWVNDVEKNLCVIDIRSGISSNLMTKLEIAEFLTLKRMLPFDDDFEDYY